jgi:hypothetical protein
MLDVDVSDAADGLDSFTAVWQWSQLAAEIREVDVEAAVEGARPPSQRLA